MLWWFSTRHTTNSRRTSRAAQGGVFAFARIRAARRQCGRAANLFEGARTGGPARWIRPRARGTAGAIARACGTHFRFRPSRRLRRWPRSTIEDHIERTRLNNANRRRFWVSDFRSWDFMWSPTCGELLVLRRWSRSRASCANDCVSEGISVRPLEAWGAPGCIRVSIGTPEQNDAFLHAAPGHVLAGLPTRRVAGAIERLPQNYECFLCWRI